MAEAKKSSETESSTENTAPAPAKKSNKTLWIVLGLVLLFVVVIPGILLTVGGLFLRDKLSETNGEKVAESLIESTTGGSVNVDAKDGNFNVESKDGSTSFGYGNNQKLPDDFPKTQIPYIDERAVLLVITGGSADKKTWSVTTEVDKSYEEAVVFFESKISSPEYTDVTSYGTGKTQTFAGKKGENSLTVTITTSAEGKTNVSYIVSGNF